MSVEDPTAYIGTWLWEEGGFHLQEAVVKAREAIFGNPGEHEHYLHELEHWVGYISNVAPHENASDHLRQLRKDLTEEDLAEADWCDIAEALVLAYDAAAQEGKTP